MHSHFNTTFPKSLHSRFSTVLLTTSRFVGCLGLTGLAVHRADSGVLSDLPFKTSKSWDSGQKTPQNLAKGRQVCQAQRTRYWRCPDFSFSDFEHTFIVHQRFTATRNLYGNSSSGCCPEIGSPFSSR